MPRFDVAHINEQGVNLIIIPLDSSFKHKSQDDQTSVIAELQMRARNAGLAGTVVPVPVEPGSDLFEKMTANHMASFKAELIKLQEALSSAAGEVDPHDACKILRRVFGEAFPIPDKPDTGVKKGPAIATSSSSANA